jgi:hypothetical protein
MLVSDRKRMSDERGRLVRFLFGISANAGKNNRHAAVGNQYFFVQTIILSNLVNPAQRLPVTQPAFDAI